MGSPNIADNDIKEIPVYGILYDLFETIESDSQLIELYLDAIGLMPIELKDITDIDVSNLNYNAIMKLDEFADENNITRITDFANEEISYWYDNDISNIEDYLDDLNSELELLNVHIESGYHDGIFLFTDSDYVYNGKPNYDDIMDDFELNTIEEAESMFNDEVNKVKTWLKTTAKNNGWKPYAGGYAGGFYDL